MWRHGDVLIAQTNEIPKEAKRLSTNVLVRGELTGHSHRIERADSAEIFQFTNTLFLNVTSDSAVLTHEEHKKITLPRGIYRVWQQREYTPQAIRRVMD